MNDSIFETIQKSNQILKLDFSSIEFAKLAEEQNLTEAQIQAVGMVFEHLQRKKNETTIYTLLKMSWLPLKDPQTFDNFDFLLLRAGMQIDSKHFRPCQPSMLTGSGVHWSGRTWQDPFGSGVWLCVMPTGH